MAEHFGIAALFKAEIQLSQPRRPELGRKLFQACIKLETSDEVAHIRRVIHGDIWGFLNPGYQAPRAKAQTAAEWSDFLRVADYTGVSKAVSSALSWLYADEPLTRFRTQLRNYLPLFRRGSFSRAAEEIELLQWGTTGGLFQSIIRVFKSYEFAFTPHLRGDSLIAPSRYYFLGLLLDIVRYVDAAFVMGERYRLFPALVRIILAADDRLVFERQSRDLNRRHLIIAPAHDPLNITFYNLGIHRYVTTNYDLEIERLMADLNFRPPASWSTADPTDLGTDLVGLRGGRARDLDLSPNTAVDLVDFAANDSSHILQAFHLHGRATEESQIVATERDYQRAYLGDDPSHDIMREGLKVLFGGNPILFLGIGLGEEDLMRPLREFLNRPIRRNRTIVALLPGDGSSAQRLLKTMSVYARYGVSVVHFGLRTDKEGHRVKEEGWLSRLTACFGKLTTCLRSLGQSIANDGRRAAEWASQSSSLVTWEGELKNILKDLGFDLPNERVPLEILSDGSP